MYTQERTIALQNNNNNNNTKDTSKIYWEIRVIYISILNMNNLISNQTGRERSVVATR